MFENEPSAHRYNSLLFKCSLLTAVVTGIVATVLTVMSISTARDMVTAGARGLVPEIADRVAAQLAGSIRFEKTEAIVGELENLVSDADGYIEFASVYGRDGAEIARAGRLGDGQLSDPGSNAAEVLSSGNSARSENGLSIAVPARFGVDNDMVGAVVLQITLAPSERLLFQEQLRSSIVALGLIIFAAALTVMILRRVIIKPLHGIGRGLSHIAEGDYDTAIQPTDRNDEIGTISRALDACRKRLSEARGELLEGAFKGAGFQSSSTPLAMLDNDRRFTYVNTAFERFARKIGLAESLAQDDAGPMSFDHLALRDLSIDLTMLERTLDTAAEFPVSLEMPARSFHLSLTIDQVLSAQDEPLGTVVEWRDVTETRMADATLKSLDQYQARAVFAPDGQYISSNAEFDLVTGLVDVDTSTLNLRRMLKSLQPAAGAARSVDDIMADQSATFGLLELDTSSGKPAYLQGGTCPVFDGSNKVMAYVLLGGDVTQVQTILHVKIRHAVKFNPLRFQ